MAIDNVLISLGTRSSSIHSEHQEPIPARFHRRSGSQPLHRKRAVQRRCQSVRSHFITTFAYFKNNLNVNFNMFKS
jgi:hypothetical protein